MADVVVAPPALQEFADSLTWYAERSVRAAENFDAEFDRVINAIANEPNRFPRCDSRHRYIMMRRFPFQVIYRQTSVAFEVIAVAHTSRQPNYWIDR